MPPQIIINKLEQARAINIHKSSLARVGGSDGGQLPAPGWQRTAALSLPALPLPAPTEATGINPLPLLKKQNTTTLTETQSRTTKKRDKFLGLT